MKSVVEVDIDLPQVRVAELHGNPELSTKWMDDVKRYEAVAGEPGAVGSQYRLLPKRGSMVFSATVLEQDPPNHLRLRLDTAGVQILVTARFVPLTPERTRLVSEQVFQFTGVLGRVFGLLGRAAIKKAHRRHIDAFKRFAEQLGASGGAA
jgi:uncharacterized protein YndB with AHSA1/START domain